MIVVDTSVWSRALRRSNGPVGPAAAVLRELVSRHEQVSTPGIVYQELLTGVRTEEQFERLRRALEPFPLLLADREDHVLAAQLGNTCRAKGIAAGTPDLLIAAITMRRAGTLLTSDRDFVRLSEILPLAIQFVPDKAST